MPIVAAMDVVPLHPVNPYLASEQNDSMSFTYSQSKAIQIISPHVLIYLSQQIKLNY